MRRLLDRVGHVVRSLVRGNTVDGELERELRFHLESQIEENLAAGMTHEEARASAMRLFGPRARIEEDNAPPTEGMSRQSSVKLYRALID